jgi:hypothetical protein
MNESGGRGLFAGNGVGIKGAAGSKLKVQAQSPRGHLVAKTSGRLKLNECPGSN